MNFRLRYALAYIFGSLLVLGGFAVASSIKSWNGTEVVTNTDINTNFSHIHDNMVGGHGARLVNADVSASAAISHAKLATPALVPKAWASVTTACSADPCTITASSGIATARRTAAGNYYVTFSVARPNDSYGVVITPGMGSAQIQCKMEDYETASAIFICENQSTGADADIGWTIMILDNDA